MCVRGRGGRDGDGTSPGSADHAPSVCVPFCAPNAAKQTPVSTLPMPTSTLPFPPPHLHPNVLGYAVQSERKGCPGCRWTALGWGWWGSRSTPLSWTWLACPPQCLQSHSTTTRHDTLSTHIHITTTPQYHSSESNASDRHESWRLRCSTGTCNHTTTSQR